MRVERQHWGKVIVRTKNSAYELDFDEKKFRGGYTRNWMQFESCDCFVGRPMVIHIDEQQTLSTSTVRSISAAE